MVLLIQNVNELYSSILLDQEFEKFLNKFPTMETNTTLTRPRSTSSHKLTAGMKFTSSAKPNKIKKNRWDQFHTRLRTLAQNCEFAEDNLDFEIEQQILVGGTSSRIRKRALRDPKYTLKDMLVDGRRDEISTYQSREIESTGHSDAQTHQIRPRQKQDNFNPKPCRNCGGTFPNKGFLCPAKGKECNLCKKPNHFASVCRSSVKPKQHNSNSRKPRKTSYRKKPGPRHDGIRQLQEN